MCAQRLFVAQTIRASAKQTLTRLFLLVKEMKRQLREKYIENQTDNENCTKKICRMSFFSMPANIDISLVLLRKFVE